MNGGNDMSELDNEFMEAEDVEEKGSVLVKTYDGWGTRSSSGNEDGNWEHYESMKDIYNEAVDIVSDNEEASNLEKIEQLKAIKEAWKNEF